MPEVADANTIQAEENAIAQNALSSSEKSLIPPTPTPEPDAGTPTLPPDTGTEVTSEHAASTTAASAGSDSQPVGADGKPSTPAWVQRRIDKLVAEKHDARRETEAIRAEADAAKAQAAALLASLAELRSGGQPAATPVVAESQPASTVATPTPAKSAIPMSEVEINARAQAMAQEIAKTDAFNRACNSIADEGKKEYQDFDAALKNFNMLGGIPTIMLETLTEMPNAHKVLYAVGKDPELAERVIKLPPLKMAMELARLDQTASQPASAKPLSAAPKPITPIDTGARAAEDIEKMSMQQFVEYRNKTKKSRW